MKHKIVWLPVVVLVFCVLNTMQAITYPTQSAVKKADHVASLVTSATLIAARAELGTDLSYRLYCLYLITLGTNSIINGMALKHNRSLGAILKFLLPIGTLCGWMIGLNCDKDGNLVKAGIVMIGAGIYVNGIKNIWDIYSLVNYNQSESVQYNA